MTGERYKQIGAVLLMLSILLWFGLPFLGTTTPTPPGNADLRWYLEMLARERTDARREATLASLIGILAGAGASLLAVGYLGNRGGGD